MNDDRLKQLLREAMPPVDRELKRDLWSGMLDHVISVSPFDWALIAAVLACVAIFPQGALAILYHL